MNLRIDDIRPASKTHRFVVVSPDGTEQIKELPEDPALFAFDLADLLGVPSGGSFRHVPPENRVA